ncbi:hypothetical protein [Luteitalea sp.]|uniref:hypothetical protein n=1 Tax=Luteitalea sp. TaxID=2004800 RepID=UPI0025BA81CE|nr:hypothetical protein [Luteitalea sp.]
MRPSRKTKTATWEAPANADLLRRRAGSTDSPWTRLLAPLRWPPLRRLAVRVLFLLVAAALLFGLATYNTGGIDAMASTLLRKEIRNELPGSATIRRGAIEVVARRPPSPDVLKHLVRMAHVLEPDDPLWSPVVHALGSMVGQPVSDDAPLLETLSSLDRATARALDMAIEGLGALAWVDMDQFSTDSVDEVASADASVGAHRFNSMRPPDGLPTSEWYLDELLPAFGDARPVAFVLVADSTGDAWRPMAFAPDQVPAGARPIRAATVGEALRVGLWGLEDYRPPTPGADVDTWWRALAARRGLPAFDQPVASR